MKKKILSTIFLSMLLGNIASPSCHCETTLEGVSLGQSNRTVTLLRTDTPENFREQNEDSTQAQRERIHALLQNLDERMIQRSRNSTQTSNPQGEAQRGAGGSPAMSSNSSGGSSWANFIRGDRVFGAATNNFQQPERLPNVDYYYDSDGNLVEGNNIRNLLLI